MLPGTFLVNFYQRSCSLHRLVIVIGKAATRTTTCSTSRTQKTNVQKLSTSKPGPNCDAPDSIRLALSWGFIVYRCTYQDDAAWHKFITAWRSIVLSRVRRYYREGERLTKTFNMTVKEERPSLENASPEEVRAQHLAWARSDPRYAAPEDDVTKDKFWTRYDFCVHVDIEDLQSCLRYIALSKEEKKVYHYT